MVGWLPIEMSQPRPLPAVRRLAALPFAVVFVWLAALPVEAQRLLTLLPSVAEASSVDGGGSMGPAPVTAIQADLDLVRSAPLVLEAPTPDGDVIYAERSAFEDRGNGDGVWFGGNREAGYDTVVLTIHEGRLIGRFGAPGGGAYRIHAASDGLGGMSPLGGAGPGQGEPWCGVEQEGEAGAGVGAESRADSSGPGADAPQGTASPQSHGDHDYLDILVAYTKEAARYWEYLGGPEAAIQHAGDVLAMVFSNNGLEVTPRIVHVVEASSRLDRAGRDLSRPELDAGIGLIDLIVWDGELQRLRHEHRADLVHLFTGESGSLPAWRAAVYTDGCAPSLRRRASLPMPAAIRRRRAVVTLRRSSTRWATVWALVTNRQVGGRRAGGRMHMAMWIMTRCRPWGRR